MTGQVYLVTGGAGFVGSNIVKRLLNEGKRVRVLDDLSTGHAENIGVCFDENGGEIQYNQADSFETEGGGTRDDGEIEFVKGDIRDRELVHKCMQGVKYVFHQAALPSVPRSIENPSESVSVAVDGTLSVLEAASKNNVKRVVYAASSSAYGANQDSPKKESFRPEPLSPYAAGKLAGEHLCKVFWECYGLETVAIRYFNVFGPRQDPKSQYAAVIPKFINAFLEKRAPTIYGDGGQTRDFTYVDNVVEANMLAAIAPKEVAGKVVNVACGESISLLDLLNALTNILGPTMDPDFQPPRPGDVRHSLADISEAEKLMGYKVVMGLEKGLEKTVEWYRFLKSSSV